MRWRDGDVDGERRIEGEREEGMKGWREEGGKEGRKGRRDEGRKEGRKRESKERVKGMKGERQLRWRYR